MTWTPPYPCFPFKLVLPGKIPRKNPQCLTMPTSAWRNVCAAQSPTLFCVNSCQLSAFIHKFCCCFFGVFFVLFCCCFFFFFSFSCFLFSLFFSCLLFATSLCLPGYRLLSDGDSKSKHWFTTSFPWRKMPKSDARSVGDSL